MGQDDLRITERLTFRLEKGLYKKLRSEGEDMSGVIRRILHEYYAKDLAMDWLPVSGARK